MNHTFCVGLRALGLIVLVASCAKEQDGPKPRVDGLDPALVCIEQLTTEVSLSGDNLSPLVVDALMDESGVVLPTVTLFPELNIDGTAASGADLLVPDTEPGSHVRWVSDSELRFDVYPELGMTAGVWGVRVANANGKSGEASNALLGLAAPVLDEVEPELICVDDGARTVTLRGTGFLFLTDQSPTVFVGATEFAPTSHDDCITLPGPIAGAALCGSLTIEVPETMTATGHPVVVTNPAPAGCSSTDAVDLFILPEPVLTSVEPADICTHQGDTVLVVTGEGFLDIDGAFPGLVISDASSDLHNLTPAGAGDLTGCTAMTGPLTPVRVCTGFSVTLPEDVSATGVEALTARVINPDPAGCDSDPVAMTRYPPPVTTSVTPTTLCLGGGRLEVSGTDFQSDASVYLEPTGGGDAIPAGSTTINTGGTLATADFSILPPGTFNVGVENPGGCVDTVDGQTVDVQLGPIALFVDPPTVYNGIDVQMTIYTQDFAGGDRPLAVSLIPAAGGSPIVIAAVDDSDLDKVRATIPAGTGAGSYHVEVAGSSGGCNTAQLTDALTVVEQLDIDLVSVDPGFGWTDNKTAITIKADDSAVGFVATPRVYLNPSTSGTAVAVQAVTYLDAATLTAMVPNGLSVDTYDVIVVNPDGTVGVSDNDAERFRVTAEPPPTIDGISPGSVPNDLTQPVTITGADFRAGVEVDFFCTDVDGSAHAVDGVINTETTTSLDVDVDTTGIFEAFCVVRVTNTDNDTFADFSSLAITNPAQKLFPFSAGPDLNVPRRALVAAAGRVSAAARYLYAIGGDDGTDDGTFDSVEATAVDVYGDPSAFVVLRDTLSVPRARAGGITVGRFVYVVGGTTDGTTALATVERAYVLSPDERPTIDDLDLEVSSVSGIGGGTWYYRVAAEMPGDDPFNPNGETLPSEALVVRFPDLGSYAVRPTITWTLVPGAAGYRVYRSPLADAAPGEEQLLTVVSGGSTSSYTDMGSSGTTAERPKPIGALGVWHTPLDPDNAPLQLVTGRINAGVTHAMADAGDVFHIYALAGHDGTGARSDYEYCSIAVGPDGEQTVSINFATGSESVATPRWMAGGYWANPVNAEHAGGEHYIYLGGGYDIENITSAVVNDVDVATIDWSNDGALNAFTPLGDAGKMDVRAGYGALLVNNFLYAFGGKNNAPSVGCSEAMICFTTSVAGSGCGTSRAPDVRSWTDTENKMLEERYLAGVALESAFIYVLGGESLDGTGGREVTATTEMTVW